MPPTDMTQEDRDRLAARLAKAERERFGGVAKDAYTAAGVNSATWSNAVNARPMKDRSLIKIVANLWPETRGDWTQIPDDDPNAGWAEQLRVLLEENRELRRRLEQTAGEADTA